MPFGGSGAVNNPNNGYIVPQPPDDTVSRLRFSPASTGDIYLIASSWNGSVRCWKVDPNQGLAAAMSIVEQGAPVLDCAWAGDGHTVYCAGASKIVNSWDLATGATTIVAAHDGPVCQVCDVEDKKLLATTSWDKTLRYWDVRAPTGSPVGSVPLADRAYAMDVKEPTVVVGLADRKLMVFDVRKPATPYKEKYSLHKYQTRCVAIWPDRMGYLVGCVDGRVSVDYVQDPEPGASSLFSCHRDKGARVGYSINAIRFHMPTGMFATAASDGRFGFWDKDRKDRARTRRFEKMSGPVTDIDFASDGRTYAYAVGYDWSKGASGHVPSPDSTYIILDRLGDGELDSKGGGGRGRGRGRRRGGGSRR